MIYVNDKTECEVYGALIHSKKLRLDDKDVKKSLIETNKCKYYVSAKQGKAFKASLVVSGYWDVVNATTAVEGLGF